MKPLDSPFRILSLDGGGIRGALSATILKQVEARIREKENKSLAEYFDLVAGTSTGAILAAGIALGLDAETMFNIYKDRGNEIFCPRRRRLRKLIPGGGGYLVPFTRYDNKGLIKVLKEKLVFQPGGTNPTLADIEKSDQNLPTLVILAYNTSKGYTEHFVSNTTKRDGTPMWQSQIPVWEACVCSAAAPTFFPPYEIINPEAQGNDKFNNYIDGGVAANNPDLAAITHAVYTKIRTNTGQPPFSIADMAVLSIGTGKVKHHFDYNKVNSWGLVDWAQKITDIFMAAPAMFEETVTQQLISNTGSNRYLRLNIALKEELSDIDDPNIIDKLVEAYENTPLEPWNLDVFINKEKAKGKTVETLVDDFIDNNKRLPGRGFKNRFGLGSG